MRLRARSGEGGTVGQWHMPLLPEGNVHPRVYSEGKPRNGQVIRTKDASLEGYSCEEGTDKLGAYHRMTARYCHGALRLHQMVTAYDGGELTVQVKLHDTRGKPPHAF